MCSFIYWMFVVVGDVWYSGRLICVWMFVSWMLFVVVGGGFSEVEFSVKWFGQFRNICANFGSRVPVTIFGDNLTIEAA